MKILRCCWCKRCRELIREFIEHVNNEVSVGYIKQLHLDILHVFTQ